MGQQRRFSNKLERKTWRRWNVGGEFTRVLRMWLWSRNARRVGINVGGLE